MRLSSAPLVQGDPEQAPLEEERHVQIHGDALEGAIAVEQHTPRSDLADQEINRAARWRGQELEEARRGEARGVGVDAQRPISERLCLHLRAGQEEPLAAQTQQESPAATTAGCQHVGLGRRYEVGGAVRHTRGCPG